MYEPERASMTNRHERQLEVAGMIILRKDTIRNEQRDI